MTKLYLNTYLVMSFLLCSSCKKDIDIFIPQETSQWQLEVEGDIEELFQALKPTPELFSFGLDAPIRLTSRNGSQINVNSLALRNESGLTPDGAVKLEFFECYNKGHMISLNRPTLTNNGDLLDSKGFFKTRFIHNGENLKLGNGLQIEFRNDSYSEATNLFRGYFRENQNLNLSTPQNWELWEGQISALDWPDSTLNSPDNFYSGYDIISNNFEWINCGELVELNENKKTTACIQLPPQFNDKNAVVFLVFNNRNSVVNLTGREEWSLFCQENMPVGEEVTILALATEGNENYFMDKVDLVISKNMTAELTPQPTTLTEIKSLLVEL